MRQKDYEIKKQSELFFLYPKTIVFLVFLFALFISHFFLRFAFIRTINHTKVIVKLNVKTNISPKTKIHTLHTKRGKRKITKIRKYE